MARRSNAGPGYAEKEKRRKRRQKAFDRSASGKLTDVMITAIFALFSLMVTATFAVLAFVASAFRWALQQLWIAAKWIFAKLKDRFGSQRE